MYECTVKENGSMGKIVFQGSLTIQNALSIKKCFSDVLIKVQELFIDHNNSTEFDTMYLQLLIALHNSASLHNKKVKWSYPKLFTTYVKDSGLSAIKCLTNNENDNEYLEVKNE
jgi:anti-anti-sigma regulatory factor